MLFALACASPDVTSESPGATEVPFHLGVNLPWHDYGVDLQATAWGDYTVSTAEDEVRSQLTTLASHGARSVRWWFFGDGRATPTFSADGTPLPLAPEAEANARMILDLAEEAGLTVMPVVLDFGWCAQVETVNGVDLGGHAGVFADPAQRAALVDDVITPLAAALADHPALAAWDLMNEPEWAFDGEVYGLGDHCDADDVRAYVDEATAAIGAVAPQPTTVGSASYQRMTTWWVDAAPPLLQFHNYWEDLSSLDAALDKPVLLGEFPTVGLDLSTTLDTAWAGGFAGAMPWSAYATDDASALDLDAFAAWAEAHEVGGTF